MAHQIIDRRTVVVPGPMGDVTPAALQAKDEAEAARDAAASSASDAAISAQAAEVAANFPDPTVAALLPGPSETRTAFNAAFVEESQALAPVFGMMMRPNTQSSFPHAAVTEFRFPTGSIVHVGGGVTSTATSLAVPVDGVYRIGAAGVWDGDSSGARALWLRVNGETMSLKREAPPSGSTFSQETQRVLELAANDVVTVMGVQSSGDTLGVSDRYLNVELIARL